MKKFLVLCMVCLLTLCGCGKIPTLQDGKEAIVTFKKDDKEHQISVEALYEELKNKYGLSALVNMIDTYIFETEFSSYKDTAKSLADNAVESFITTYGSEEDALSVLNYYYGYETFDAYRDAYYLVCLQNYARKEYAKSLLTDEEIQNYYDKEAKGDIEVYHILITPDVSSNASEDETKEAEAKAKATAEEIIKKLNDLDKDANILDEFKKLVKEYSEDESTKNKDGNLGYINLDFGEDYDELIDAAYKLKDGEYSKSVVTTELGYHVIYRNASKEKESFDDLKDEIIDILAQRKIDADSKMGIKSLQYYRELYNMKIVDDEIDRQYGISVNNQLNAKTTEE